MVFTAATLALLCLLPQEHPLRRAACRTVSAGALACALRLPFAAGRRRRAD